MTLSDSQADLLFTFVEVLVQTLAYGAFIALIPISTHVLSKQGLKLRPNLVMLVITLFIFALSTAYWAVSVKSLLSKITSSGTEHQSTVIRQLFNAIILLNYLFADGVVVWRMRVLCKGQFSRAILNIPYVALGITAVSVCTTVGLRIAVTAAPGSVVPRHSLLATAIDVSQISNLAFSLITNIIATAIICIWAWRYRRTIAANLKVTSASTQIEGIMVLVAESGLIYCVSSMLVLASSFTHVTGGTLGDIYTGIHVQIAGMYPALVAILVNYQRSSRKIVTTSFLDNNVNFSSKKTGPLEEIRFTDGPASRFRNGTLITTGRTERSIAHVTLDMHDEDDHVSTVSEGRLDDDNASRRDDAFEHDWRRAQLDVTP